MECRSCYEVFDEFQRIPRNLPCGHTYCEICLDQVVFVKKRLECPECRHKVEPPVKPSALSKNFIAIEIATKHRDIQKKLLFCSTHKEPLRFFCEDCQQNICPSCILDHNGHHFVKQDHSVSLLIQRGKDLKSRVSKKMQELTNKKRNQEENLKDLNNSCQQEIKRIDTEFEMLISHLVERKTRLKKEYQEVCQNEIVTLDKEVAKADDFMNNMNKNVEEVYKYLAKLDSVKVIQEDTFEKELKNIEETVEQNSYVTKEMSEVSSFLPKVIFDNTVYKELESFGITSREVKNPIICFFGEKNKVLMYHIETDEWTVAKLPFREKYEFNYYGSAVTLPNGSIIITGGGVSNAVCQISFEDSHHSKKSQLKVKHKEPMLLARKEHASIYLQNAVYVLGGYNGVKNTFLSSCERFDLETNEWSQISDMQVPKCAFGATTLANRYIFTVGGYDGFIRLNIIEKYDISTGKWTSLDFEMKQPLSNCACFAYSDRSIMILGGGHNVGFSLDMMLFDVESHEWKYYPAMADGKDLRNKVAVFNGEVFAIGGNNCIAEKYSIKENKWNMIDSYQDLISDNLDSWACSLYYVTKKTEDVSLHSTAYNSRNTYQIPSITNYQTYHYNLLYEEEEGVSYQTSSSDQEDNF